MKLKYLFFSLVSIFILDNDKNLLAYNIADTASDHVSVEISNNEDWGHIENICDLILKGHSIEQIVELYNKNQMHQCDVQKISEQIHGLLDKKYSREEVIKIVKDSEGYDTYLILKIALVVGIAIAILCILYKFWSESKGQDGDRQHSEVSSYHEGCNEQSSNQQRMSDDRIQQSEATTPIEVPQNIPMQAQTINDQVPEGAVPLNEPIGFEQPREETSIRDGIGISDNRSSQAEASMPIGLIQDIPSGIPVFFDTPVGINLRLLHEIDEQIRHAAEIGLSSTPQHSTFVAITPNHPMSNWCRVGIDEQIEYARSIGLNPEMLQI